MTLMTMTITRSAVKGGKNTPKELVEYESVATEVEETKEDTNTVDVSDNEIPETTESTEETKEIEETTEA